MPSLYHGYGIWTTLSVVNDRNKNFLIEKSESRIMCSAVRIKLACLIIDLGQIIWFEPTYGSDQNSSTNGYGYG